jgi:hypothetical protein
MKINEIIAYHGTDTEIAKFRPLTHFGSEKAASDRIGYKKLKNGKVYKVKLDIKNPAVIRDFPGVHAPTQFAFALKDAKIFNYDEMYSVSEHAGKPEIQIPILVKLLKSKGYDGIAYKNRYEDKGHISYVILDPDQVTLV